MNQNQSEPEFLAQTDNFVIWSVTNPDGESIIHLDLDKYVLRFLAEEWDEFIEFKSLFVDKGKPAADGVIAETDSFYIDIETLDSGDKLFSLEVPGATVYLYEDDFGEFCELMREVE